MSGALCRPHLGACLGINDTLMRCPVFRSKIFGWTWHRYSTARNVSGIPRRNR